MGRMPDRFARKGAAQKAEYFKEQNKLDWPSAKTTKQSKKDVRSAKALEVRWDCACVRACVLILILTHSKSLSRATTTTGHSSISCANCSGLTPWTEYGCATPSSIRISAPRRRAIIHRTCRALWILCCMHTCTEYDVNWTRPRPILDAQSTPASLAMSRLSDDRKSSTLLLQMRHH